jgi:hypothetical protein
VGGDEQLTVNRKGQGRWRRRTRATRGQDRAATTDEQQQTTGKATNKTQLLNESLNDRLT